jgi:hypothetical protein
VELEAAADLRGARSILRGGKGKSRLLRFGACCSCGCILDGNDLQAEKDEVRSKTK